MSDSFRVTWRISDGYAGGDRPHHFDIPASYFSGDEDEDDLRRLFDEELQREFEEKIYPYSDDDDKFMEWARERVAEIKAKQEEEDSNG